MCAHTRRLVPGQPSIFAVCGSMECPNIMERGKGRRGEEQEEVVQESGAGRGVASPQ